MNTPGQQPETFAQLLAKATPGPFGVSESGKSIRHGDPEEYLSVCHTSFETTEHTPADMELITRLLNFAHAGGYQFLYDLMRYDGARLTADDMEQLEILLKTLNNPSK